MRRRRSGGTSPAGRPCITGRGALGPFKSPALRSAIRLLLRTTAHPRVRKSQRAVTRDVNEALLATCGSDRLVDTRDAALLLGAFASGGRRRSEVASLRVEELIEEQPVLGDPTEPDSPALPCLSIPSAAPRPPKWTPTPQSVNAILTRRVVAEGLDPKLYSAHGLRVGYLTEAARSRGALPEAMQQSQHRSVQQAASYYNDVERRLGRAARLV
jgi:integrase